MRLTVLFVGVLIAVAIDTTTLFEFLRVQNNVALYAVIIVYALVADLVEIVQKSK